MESVDPSLLSVAAKISALWLIESIVSPKINKSYSDQIHDVPITCMLLTDQV